MENAETASWGTGDLILKARVPGMCYSRHMAKPKPDSPAAQAQALSIPPRLLLFCVASRTEWERAGITRATVTTTVVRGLIERDVAGGLTITKQGRAVLAALLMEEDE
jgi:hypothetical protein